MGYDRSILVAMYFVSSQAEYVLAGMDAVWSTHVEMNLQSSLAFEGFGQHI